MSATFIKRACELEFTHCFLNNFSYAKCKVTCFYQAFLNFINLYEGSTLINFGFLIKEEFWYVVSILDFTELSWQPLFPTQLDCAHFVFPTSVSTPSRFGTRLLLHISIVIRLITTHPDYPHFDCAHSVIHFFVAIPDGSEMTVDDQVIFKLIASHWPVTVI